MCENGALMPPKSRLESETLLSLLTTAGEARQLAPEVCTSCNGSLVSTGVCMYDARLEIFASEHTGLLMIVSLLVDRLYRRSGWC